MSKQFFYDDNCQQILRLMALLEDRHKKCFHEVYPDLDETCVKALDGEIHASFVINQLSKLVDESEADDE